MIVSPTTDRGRATVTRVLDAACLLFARQGIRDTTLDEIGALADVGRSQLYHFFASKSDLVADVISLQVERLIADLQPSLQAMSNADDVRGWCTAAVAYHESSQGPIRCPIGSLVYELDNDAADAQLALGAGFARWEAMLAEALRRVGANGCLAAGVDPALLAIGLLAAYQGGMLIADATGNVMPLQRALQAVLATALVSTVPATARLG